MAVDELDAEDLGLRERSADLNVQVRRLELLFGGNVVLDLLDLLNLVLPLAAAATVVSYNRVLT